jgi:dUTP pyrophosphatase
MEREAMSDSSHLNDQPAQAEDAPSVGLEILPHASDLPLPTAMTRGASGYDLRAAIDTEVVLQPGRLAVVPTGLRLEMPDELEAQVRPRSGLAAQHQVGVLNSPGTVDSDYRGEVKVLLFNFGAAPFHIGRGDRIAQLVFARVYRPKLEVRRLSDTERSSGGFGHTGSS